MFELDGFTVERQTASHIILSKTSLPRPVVIPKYAGVGIDIIKANMRTAGMSREKFLALLERA